MLYAMSLQSACVGFLFHWLISDGLYLESNVWMRSVLYFLFIFNMLGVAYGHIIFNRNEQITEAVKAMNNNTA